MTKKLSWLGKSREVVQGFVKTVRAEIGYQLYLLQQGLMPTDFKPMISIGKGVYEIRLHRPHEHRVIYVTKFHNRIYILHAFEKKTQKTSQQDIEIARKNYQGLLQYVQKFKVVE